MSNEQNQQNDVDWEEARRYVLDLQPVVSDVLPLLVSSPDFLCIGAQKSGTTWLYKNLLYHPLIWLPPIKEINYFTSLYVKNCLDNNRRHRKQQIFESRSWWISAGRSEPVRRPALECLALLEQELLTTDWYRRIFSYKSADQLSGDITPDYCLLPRAGIRHALEINPAIKIIVLLRDPAERALAHARMLCGKRCTARALLDLSMSDVFDTLAQYSDYPRWLARWDGIVFPGNVHIDYLNEISHHPLKVLMRACKFLGIPFHTKLFPEAHHRVFEGPKAEEDMGEVLYVLRQKMRRIYEELKIRYPEIYSVFCP